MTDIGYMESNPHGDGRNPTWDDLRVATTDGWARPLTPAERDTLGRAWATKSGWRLTDTERAEVGRAWLREKIGVDLEDLSEVGFCVPHQQPTLIDATHCGFVYWVESRHSVEQAHSEASKCRVVPGSLAVLDALDGGQE